MNDSYGQLSLGHSFRAEWAKRLVLSRIAEFYNSRPQDDIVREKLPELGAVEPGKLPTLPETKPDREADPTGYKVCIIGAGAAGLFTAMTIDYLNEMVPDLNFSYDILEAADETRFGGRLYTHRFSEALHDYYDVGAMRFPDIPIMKRTFQLFSKLGFQMQDHPSTGVSSEPVKLIPYYFGTEGTEGANKCPYYYNDLQYPMAPMNKMDPFQVQSNGQNEKIPEEYLMFGSDGPKKALKAAVEPFKIKLREDVEKHTTTGWELMMQADKYSVRQYLARSPNDKDGDLPKGLGYNFRTIEWMETFGSGTLNYDQAFTETVLGELDFDYYSDKTDVKWWCVEGGTQKIVEAIEQKIKGRVQFNSRVTMIKYDRKIKGDNDMEVRVGPAMDNKKREDVREYAAVFNSSTLASMQRMDLTGAVLNYGTKLAIRALRYGPSCKVAIKFKQAWWITDLGINRGGVGYTDLPIRMCVYPSYNINDTEGEAVLLCSYLWGQDAQRLGALISKQTPDCEEQLKEVLFHDLTLLHTIQKDRKKDETAYQTMYQKIKSLYITHHAYDWNVDEYTAGAFAHFAPGQFSKLYPDLITPSAGGKLFIVGEAASKHHAWVVGALESAVRGVFQLLQQYSGIKNDAVRKAREILEDPKNRDTLFGLPYEETHEIVKHQSFIAHVREEAKRTSRPT